jgi:aspartyl-tRNA synthetase
MFKVDLEMAFSDGEAVMRRVEKFIRGLFKRNPHRGSVICTKEITFPRMTYYEAMHKYGSDKPDLRIPEQVGFL